MKQFYIFLACIAFAGCNDTLHHAWQIADASGNPEMRQVIEHYKDDTAKLSAAVYLIENLAGYMHSPG